MVPKQRRFTKRGAFGRIGFSGAIGTAARLGMRAYRGWSNTKSKTKKSTAGGGVTHHYDARWVYRRRRMPRRRRRRWVRFIRKVRAVTTKDYGSHSIIRNNSQIVISGNGQQAVSAVELYGLDGTAPTTYYGGDDLRQCTQAVFNALPSNQKLIFKSGVLDLTMTNTTNASGEELQLVNTAEVDVYRCVYRKKSKDQNIGDLITHMIADTATEPGAAAVTQFTRGWTPFQCPQLCSYLKVLSKKKFLLERGQSATYQIRDPRNRVFRTQNLEEFTGNDCMMGWTQILLFITKHVADNAGPAPSASVVYGVTRTYNLVVEKESGDLQGFI